LLIGDAWGSLETQLAMRSEAYKLEVLCVRLPIDQNEVRSDVTIAKIPPLAGKRVIEVAPREHLIIRQKPYYFCQISIEAPPMPTGFLSTIIALELSRIPNTPH